MDIKLGITFEPPLASKMLLFHWLWLLIPSRMMCHLGYLSNSPLNKALKLMICLLIIKIQFFLMRLIYPLHNVWLLFNSCLDAEICFLSDTAQIQFQNGTNMYINQGNQSACNTRLLYKLEAILHKMWTVIVMEVMDCDWPKWLMKSLVAFPGESVIPCLSNTNLITELQEIFVHHW